MGLGVVILPALIGYWCLTRLHYTSFRILRDTGYHVLFKSALAGIVLAIVARVPVLFLLPWCPEWVVSQWKMFAPFDFSGTILASAALALVVPWIGNAAYDKRRAFERVADEDGNAIAALVSDSINYRIHIEVSLKSGKSYMGYAFGSGREGPRSQSDVRLLLSASGYRREDTRELVITTNYAELQAELQDAPDSRYTMTEFQVVFPLEDVASARPFNPEVFEMFQERKQRHIQVTG